MAKRRTIEPGRLSADTQRVFDVFNTGTDLACVLTAVSYLDECLRTLLLQRMAVVAEAESLLAGALGRFSVRRDLAYCLGLIDTASYRDLATIGEIRNRFAHSHLAMTFDDFDMQQRTRTLVRHGLEDPPDREAYQAQLTDVGRCNNARTRFSMSAAFIAQELLITAHHTVHDDVREPYA